VGLEKKLREEETKRQEIEKKKKIEEKKKLEEERKSVPRVATNREPVVFQDTRSRMIISDKLTSGLDLRVREIEKPKVIEPHKNILSEESLFGESTSIDVGAFKKTSLDSSLFDDDDVVKKLESRNVVTKPTAKTTIPSTTVFDEGDDLFSNFGTQKSSSSVDDDLFSFVDKKNSATTGFGADMNIADYIATQKNSNSGGLFD